MSTPDEPDGVTGRPSVSFLCCAYRTEDTIIETLESVRRQTRDDWQLVVVDNGPSDEIERLVRPYLADPRVVLVRQDNARAAGGVNAAARVAEGRYVAVLHTDDLVVPTYLERMVAELDARPDVHALSCDAHYLTERGLRRATYRGPVPEHYRRGTAITLREMVEGWIPYYTALVRKDAWDAVGGFRLDAPSVEDLALWVDLMTAGYVTQVLEEPLGVYREDDHSDSRGLAGAELMEESFERVLTAAVEQIGTPDDEEALRAALLRSRHRRAAVRARRLLLDRDVPGAREAAATALALRPDPETRLIAAGLRWAPWALRALYRAKKWLLRWQRRLSPRTPLPSVEAHPGSVEAR